MDYRYKFLAAALFSVATLGVGCTGDSSEENRYGADELVKCQFSSREELGQIKKAFKSATLIPLEQSGEESMVSSDCEVVEFDGGYLLVNRQQRSCVRFDQKGNYKCHIGRSGRAGDEYLNIASVQVDGDEILIYSSLTSTIYRYDINGNFRSSADTNIQAQQLLKVGDIYYGYFGYTNGQQDERVLLFDSNFERIGQYLPFEAKIIVFSEGVASLTTHDGEVYIRETYNNCIHKMSGNAEPSTPIAFDFNSYNIPSEALTQSDALKAAEIVMSSDFASIYRFDMGGDYALVQVNYQITSNPANPYCVVGVKQGDGEYSWVTATPTGANAILFSTTRHISEDGEVTALVDRHIVEEFASKGGKFIDNIDLLHSAKGDNPVIVKFKM